jgi:threonine dehydrogenase-like Zn-dependent dehydrogenase
MRAIVMRNPGHVSIEERPDPVCGFDEVLMQTEAVSICSTDVSYFKGHLHPERWPIIPGHEYVGRVIEVGPRVDERIRVGDRLVYWGQTDFGGLAERRTLRPLLAGATSETSWYTHRNFHDADQAAAVLVPDSMDSLVATLTEPLTSVLRSLLVNPPRPGDTCVVLGCGPSGLLAVQVLCRYLGAAEVIVIDKDQSRIDTAMRLGAARGFNMTAQQDDLEALVRAHEDACADYAFDALPHVETEQGSADVRKLAMSLVRPGGSYVIYGASETAQQIHTWMILAKGLQLKATPFDVRSFPMARSAHVMRIALSLIKEGIIDTGPLVSAVVAADDEAAVAAAFADYGKHGSLKTSFVYKEAPLPRPAHPVPIAQGVPA